jgi:uncharacterized protein (DUF4415 family)
MSMNDFEAYHDMDFSGAKRGAVIPLDSSKLKISIRLDAKVIRFFREQVEAAGGGNYQTLINEALVAFTQQKTMIETIRQVVREELRAQQTQFSLAAD